MSPNVPAQPAPILSGGTASMLGAQGAVAGPGILFAGSTGSGAGVQAGADAGRPVAESSEQGRRVIEEMLRGRYRNEPWVQDMKEQFEKGRGRPPEGFRSWQEVYDSYELLGTGADRDPLRGTAPRPPKGSRK